MMKMPKIVYEFRGINRKKTLIINKKDIQAVMNALDHYKDNPFTEEYKYYLDSLRSKFLMLGEW